MDPMDVRALARDLLSEARRADERRLLVLSGDPEETARALREVVEAVDVPRSATTLVGPRDLLACERVETDRSDRLLGTTRSMIVLDAHEALRPNAVGRVVGAVDGGGLLVVLAPPLSHWPDDRDAFDETLVVDPYGVGDVAGNFRRRFVETLRSHPGVAVVDVDAGCVESDGLIDPAPRLPRDPIEVPDRGTFPALAYESCLTADQAAALRAFEPFHPRWGSWPGPDDGNADPTDDGTGDDDVTPRAVVLEADRGRGKSSAAGLAAACLALAGRSVLVTAPEFSSAREVFARASTLLDELDQLEGPTPGPSDTDGDGTGDPPSTGGDGIVDPPSTDDVPRSVETPQDGEVYYLPPGDAVDRAESADMVVVDEAAALPVGRLTATLAADRVAYATTVHGYEGAGRGFSVRFRDRLAESRHEVTDVELAEPIRYAAGDPVESWTFRALALDARPAVDPLVVDATPDSVSYRRIDPAELLEDEHLLREVFGLLVLAHYRTEPDDLARILDAPNLRLRALTHDGHVVSVALLAREGSLDADRRASMYEGERVRGHMLPDVLTSQLRDEAAAVPVGWRVMRIATHHAVRSGGLGSRLLEAIRREAGGERRPDGVDHDGDRETPAEPVDWLGVGYGATPELLEFWTDNGFRTVHLSTTRNERSGEHSAIMLDPITDAGRALTERHARWFLQRVGAMLADSLSALEPDVVRLGVRSAGVTVAPDLSDRDWRVVVGASYGPGMFAVDPSPFRRLALAHLSGNGAGSSPDAADLTPDQERLLVAAVLQARPVPAVAASMGYHSVGNCLRAIGEAYRPLVDCFGGEVALEERERFLERGDEY